MKNTGIIFAIFIFATCSCGSVSFNMSGANFGNARTCQVVTFENRAENFNPRLTSQMTDALKDKIQSNSSLRLVNSSADVMFEGEITGYTVQSGQITAAGVAAKDRLTVTVKVKFTNSLESDKSYDKQFSHFREYDGGTQLNAVEATLVEEIQEELMEDIYNEAFASW